MWSHGAHSLRGAVMTGWWERGTGRDARGVWGAFSFFCCFSEDQPGHALPGIATQSGLSGHRERALGPRRSFLNRASHVRVASGAPETPFTGMDWRAASVSDSRSAAHSETKDRARIITLDSRNGVSGERGAVH